MAKSKYLRLYERVCPSDKLLPDDPRASEIDREMRDVVHAKDNKATAKAIEWWGWDSPQQLIGFVVRARRVWKTL